MPDELPHHDRIETLLADMQSAERANVFARTPVDPQVLVSDARRTYSMFRMRRMAGWLSAAAVVGLTFGIWHLSAPYRGAPQGVMIGKSTGKAGDPCDGSFIRCFSGPEPIAMTGGCLSHDYDADGDIDLADYRDHQIKCNRPPSARP